MTLHAVGDGDQHTQIFFVQEIEIIALQFHRDVPILCRHLANYEILLDPVRSDFYAFNFYIILFLHYDSIKLLTKLWSPHDQFQMTGLRYSVKIIYRDPMIDTDYLNPLKLISPLLQNYSFVVSVCHH